MGSPYPAPGRGYAMDAHARQMAGTAQQAADTAASAAASVRPSTGGPVPAGALAPLGSISIVVPFTPAISGTYIPVATLTGPAALLGGLTLAGIAAKTSTTVTVVVKAGAPAVGAGVSVSVVCFRTT